MAKLILKDGTIVEGRSFGSATDVAGEVVFNTGMVGYPETLTDPSYRGQILVCTYPHIGNYGIPDESRQAGMMKHFESERIQISGLIVADYSEEYSHFQAKQSLGEWMRKQGIPGITGVDTRSLTKHLRTKGVMLGRVENRRKISFEDPNKRDLVADVTIKKPIVYNPGKKRKVILVDCGAKNNIVRSLIRLGVTVKRVPFDHPFEKEHADGILISNGPGDPKMCVKTIDSIRQAMSKETPIFGICLGNQLLALAAGADTYKLKFGHRSQNQPAIELQTKRCYITSQNHGFAVNPKKLKRGWAEWFINANDKTNEGIRHVSKPFYSVQFHPEATPGPTDAAWLFEKFMEDIR